MRIFRVADALVSLGYGSFVTQGEEFEDVEWITEPTVRPTHEQIIAEIIRLQNVYNASEYARKRAMEYPSIGDQLDALFKGGAFQQYAPEMAAKLQAVKNKYAKPDGDGGK